MMVFVAELMVDHDQALRVVREGQLPGHADTTMQLDAFLGDERTDAADADLRRRQRALAHHTPRAERSGGIDDRRARLLDLQQQVGHAVLQRLEAADRNAELLARAQIVEREVLRDIHRAECLRA